MDNKHIIIKSRVNQCYAEIKEAEKLLEHLRKECDHSETKLVNYEWAPGHINPDTKICKICGEIIIKQIGWINSISIEDGECSTELGGNQND